MIAAAAEVVEFWFGADPDDPACLEEKQELWWNGGSEIDARIRARFLPTWEAAAAGRLDDWSEKAASCLALVLVLDQFTRNLFRGTAKAFAADPQALRLTRQAIAEGFDRGMSPAERTFLYMPLEHSESLADQNDMVRLLGELAAQVDDAWKEHVEGFLRYSRDHRDVIERFGRFPHRNAVLGRTPTTAETRYLEGGGATYGQ